jgi:plasmid stabilization system protein ParE
MNIQWTKRSLSDLEGVAAPIAADDSRAASALITEILHSTENILADHPNVGRPGRVADTREWVAHTNYVVAYRQTSVGIQILAVIHSARLWPNRL